MRRAVYVHGMNQNTSAELLHAQWDSYLFDGGPVPADIRTDMAYWADQRKMLPPLELTERELLMMNFDPMWDDALDKVTRIEYFRDVHEYLFNEQFRSAVQSDVIATMTDFKANPSGLPDVVVSHSLGTIIAYDVLRHFDFESARPVTLITLGSPLGIEAVEAHQRRFYGERPPKVPAVVHRWFNLCDARDPVAFDKDLADDYASELIIDELVCNLGAGPHDIAGYLSDAQVRSRIFSGLLT